jgi:predicted Rossmann-fold nucleotide-binding protein
MESYLTPDHYDLVSPDGRVTQLKKLDPKRSLVTVQIEHISPAFIGYEIPESSLLFNLKSTLAQLGMHSILRNLDLDQSRGFAELEVELQAFGHLAVACLEQIQVGAYIGKLFAADDRRKVRDPDYLTRLFGRSDRKGRPLLSLGSLEGSGDLILEKIQGRTVAFLSVRDGVVVYHSHVYGLLPTLGLALNKNLSNTRQLIQLHQSFVNKAPRITQENEILLVKTAPLHIRTVYARVVDALLPQGFHHTSSNILQPDTYASGDIYELYGNSNQVLDDIPLEFFTLEPHREHVFFSDRDQLISSLEDPKSLFAAMETAPRKGDLASVFIVKGTQMHQLQEKDWITREPLKYEFPGLVSPIRQGVVVEKFIEHQPSYPFLKAIEDGLITSQGVLLSRHFPSPLLKRMILNDQVTRCLKRIYFQLPSQMHDGYFSHEDRAFLVDLAKVGVPAYWIDEGTNKILQYVHKPENDSGMFVPLPLVDVFRKATLFGVYGSNLQEGNLATELEKLLSGILAMREHMNHPLLCKDTPLALVTGGGPGAMAVGNRVAKSVGILSCANIVDFRTKDQSIVNEQQQNPYIDAKMTYRLDRLVERQAEFYLNFPIFLAGGIGTDFEYTLEEVRRKTGGAPANPILLFGSPEYWQRKVASRFQLNQESGTIKGSEWVSNCFYCIQNAEQGLEIYRKFFENKLPIGKSGPIYPDGFWHKNLKSHQSSF